MARPTRRDSSTRWLLEHRTDPHVLAARREGYRSRAAYKFLEIQEKFKLLKPGMRVVDLGAAPGGWSQVAATLVVPGGRVVAVDLLPMATIPGPVTFLQGDFLDETVLAELRTLFHGGRVQAILSDMAANMSGIRVLDTARGERLTEAVFDFTETMLAPEGLLVVKLFQSAAFEELVVRARALFRTVRMAKPAASRDRSPEQYLIGMGFVGADRSPAFSQE